MTRSMGSDLPRGGAGLLRVRMTRWKAAHTSRMGKEPLRFRIVARNAIDGWWPRIRPLVEKCVARSFHGELCADDLLPELLEGRMVAGVGLRGEEGVEYACVFEACRYPNLNVASCIVSAASTPGAFAELMGNGEWGKLKAFMKSHGFGAVSFLARRGAGRLVRMLEPGYEPIYTMYRMKL